MSNRKEIRKYNPSGSEMYIIRKSHDGKRINVVRFDRDYEASEFIVNIVGKENGCVYELKGVVVLDEPVGHRHYGSLKKVSEDFDNDIIEYGHYVG